MTLPQAPFGYEWKDDVLVHNDVEQAVISAINNLLAKGYTYTSIGRFMEEEGYLMPREPEQAILNTIKLLRESGLTYARIAEELAERGHLTKRGGRWRAASLRRIYERMKEG